MIMCTSDSSSCLASSKSNFWGRFLPISGKSTRSREANLKTMEAMEAMEAINLFHWLLGGLLQLAEPLSFPQGFAA